MRQTLYCFVITKTVRGFASTRSIFDASLFPYLITMETFCSFKLCFLYVLYRPYPFLMYFFKIVTIIRRTICIYPQQNLHKNNFLKRKYEGTKYS